jgi:hypothetical protein
MSIKRTLIIPVTAIAMGCAFLHPMEAIAQKEAGKVVITGGAGVSLIGLASSFTINTDGDNDHFRANPFLTGSVDVGVAKIFSLGLSYSNQYMIYTYHGDKATGKEAVWYSDKFVRNHYGLRALFHFGKKEKVDMYAGARLGISVWNISTTNNQYSDYQPEDAKGGVPWALRVNLKNTHYTAQAIYGFRYFFNEHIGINFEIGIGPPGLLMFGLNGKF